jgi:hypothetical protein
MKDNDTFRESKERSLESEEFKIGGQDKKKATLNVI